MKTFNDKKIALIGRGKWSELHAFTPDWSHDHACNNSTTIMLSAFCHIATVVRTINVVLLKKSLLLLFSSKGSTYGSIQEELFTKKRKVGLIVISVNTYHVLFDSWCLLSYVNCIRYMYINLQCNGIEFHFCLIPVLGVF